jgi:hypothetical protein
MADYHPLITRAVEGLGTSTAEARRTLYERARTALVAQLRGVKPPLSEAEITRERLALEDAIRKVEAESVRKGRAEPRPPGPPPRSANLGNRASPAPPPVPSAWRERPDGPPPPSPPPQRHDKRLSEPARNEPPPLRRPSDPIPSEPGPPEAQISARNRLLGARPAPAPREEMKGFHGAGAHDLDASDSHTAPPPNDMRDPHPGAAPAGFSDEEKQWHQDRVEPRLDNDRSSDLLDDVSPPMRGLEPSHDYDDEGQIVPVRRPRAQRPREADPYRAPRPPRSYRGMARLIVVLAILGALAAAVAWQWSNITALYSFVSHMRSRQTPVAQQPAAEPKIPGRVPQEQTPGQAPAASPNAQNVPATAQRVVLYEEDPGNPQGKQYVGSAVWRTETVSPGSGLAPELQVRADITIPERNMSVTWKLRRNTDQALPASHTIEIMFNLPPDFPGGGVANVPGVLMKESEQARGVPLAGLAVKVTNGFFLIGLSAVDADVQRNMQLLKDRPWFDIPIVYNNGGRAILAMEKGAPGDRAFADAFAAWSK